MNQQIIRLPKALHSEVTAHLFPDEGPQPERAAFLLANRVEGKDRGIFLGYRLVVVPEDAYLEKADDFLQVKSEFICEVARMAAAESAYLIELHSHPGCVRKVGFSRLDCAGQARFQKYLTYKLGGPPWGALVFGRESVSGSVWLPGTESSLEARVQIVGENWQEFSNSQEPVSLRFDRQQVFGLQAQRALASMKIGLVGLRPLHKAQILEETPFAFDFR